MALLVPDIKLVPFNILVYPNIAHHTGPVLPPRADGVLFKYSYSLLYTIGVYYLIDGLM